MSRTENIKTFSILILMSLIFGIAFSSTMEQLLHEWSEVGPYNHGYLSLAVAFYIFWKESHLLQDFRLKPFWPGYLLCGGFSLLWWLATIVNVSVIQFVALWCIANSIFLTLYNTKTFQKLQLPMLVLLFAMPVWQILQIPLREISTWVSFFIIDLTGIPNSQNGYVIYVPGGSFIVEEACSGLGFFLTSISLGLVFSYLNELTKKQAFYFVSIVMALSIVTNWIRIISIIVVGDYTQMKHFIVTDHLTFGWIVFSVALFPLLWTGHRLFPALKSTAHHADVVIQKHSLKTWAAITLITLTLIFPILNVVTQNKADIGKAHFNLSKNLSLTIEIQNLPLIESWSPNFIGADITSYKKLSQNNKNYFFYSATYNVQQQGKELIYFENTLYDDAKWALVNTTSYDKVGANALTILELKNNKGGTRYIAFWYLIGNIQTNDKYAAKLLEVYRTLSPYSGSSVIAVMADDINLSDIEALAGTLNSAIELEN